LALVGLSSEVVIVTADLKPPYGDSVLVRDPAQLRDARKTAGITVQQVADAAGLAASAIGHLEVGRYRWTALRSARGISSAVGVDLGDLFDASHLGLIVRDGAALRAAREDAGLSRKALGERVRTSASTIDQLENGTRRVLWRHEVGLLAAALGVDVRDLFDEQDLDLRVPA
jgi:transcriptional regulator with XRE-family HTH domain